LRTGDVNVPEIGRKLRQQELDIGPVAIPRNESMDRGGVPQIVKTGLITGTIVPKNAGTIPHASESVLSDADGDRTTVSAGKYR
jgi:hypothetical protein